MLGRSFSIAEDAFGLVDIQELTFFESFQGKVDLFDGGLSLSEQDQDFIAEVCLRNRFLPLEDTNNCCFNDDGVVLDLNNSRLFEFVPLLWYVCITSGVRVVDVISLIHLVVFQNAMSEESGECLGYFVLSTTDDLSKLLCFHGPNRLVEHEYESSFCF
jgi:hypothetical protein